MRANKARDLTPPADSPLRSGSPVPSSSADTLRSIDPGAQTAADALGLAMPTGFADLVKGNGTDNATAALPQLRPMAAGDAIPAGSDTGVALSASARLTADVPTDRALAPANGDAAVEAAAPEAPIPHTDPPGPDMAPGAATAPANHQFGLIGATRHGFGRTDDRADDGAGSDFARAEPQRSGPGHRDHDRTSSLNSSADISANLATASDGLADLSSRLHDRAADIAERVHEITSDPPVGLGSASHHGSSGHPLPADAIDDPASDDHASSTSDDHASASSQDHAALHDGPSVATQSHDPHPHADVMDDAHPAAPDAGDNAAATATTHSVAAGHETATAITAPAADSAPSLGPLIESGARAILLQSDAAPSAASPPPVAGPHHTSADNGATAATPAFAPDILSARDQLASAIATASPEAAAMTTMKPADSTALGVPTLGADVHAMHTPIHGPNG